MGEKLSDDYNKRDQLLKASVVPPFSLVREKLGGPLAEIYFASVPKCLRKSHALEPKLQGPGEDLWVSPSDQIAGHVKLKPPLTTKYIRALTHEGILEIGGKIEEKRQKEFVEEKLKALAEDNEVWKFIVDSEYKKAVARTEESERDKHNKDIEFMIREFEKLYETSLLELEDHFRMEANETMKETVLQVEAEMKRYNAEDLMKQEKKLKKQFAEKLDEEVAKLTEHFELVLHNEQVRTTCLLREARRERQEKINILRSQLECRNMASLMFAVCAERKKCKIEKSMMKNEYTDKIKNLATSLTEKDRLIEELKVTGKDAEVLNSEWKHKICEIVRQFKSFITFCLRTVPEQAEFLLNLEELLVLQMNEAITKTRSSGSILLRNCDEMEGEGDWLMNPPEKGDEATKKPFVIYGDMFDARKVKYGSQETIPLECSLHEITVDRKHIYSDCANWDKVMQKQLAVMRQDNIIKDEEKEEEKEEEEHQPKKESSPFQVQCSKIDSKRESKTSGRMGSILKMMYVMPVETESNKMNPGSTAKEFTGILGATDSLEIASSTKLIAKFNKAPREEETETTKHRSTDLERLSLTPKRKDKIECVDNKFYTNIWQSKLSLARDSVEIISNKMHKPLDMTSKKNLLDKDKIIDFEKECPVSICEKKPLGGMSDYLPPYMNIISPYQQVEISFKDYEPCTPEQLEMILERNKSGKSLNLSEHAPYEFKLPRTHEITTQTSTPNIVNVCLCQEENYSDDEDSEPPPKRILDHITQSKMFDQTVEFNRFKLVGENDPKMPNYDVAEFAAKRMTSIQRILNIHPSIAEMFLPENINCGA